MEWKTCILSAVAKINEKVPPSRAVVPKSKGKQCTLWKGIWTTAQPRLGDVPFDQAETTDISQLIRSG